MRTRYQPLSTLIMLGALATLGLSPSEAHAISLQDCPAVPGANPPRLPIGHAGADGAELYPDKKELRGYLETLTAADLTFPGALPDIVNPVVHYRGGTQNWGGNCTSAAGGTATLTPNDEKELERLWVVWTQMYYYHDDPAFYFLGLPAQDFLLSSMEDTASCTAMTPSMEWDPMVSWLANWSYPGNPYFTDATVRNVVKSRGASWLALQLIMLDWNHWGGALPTGVSSSTTFLHPAAALTPPSPGRYDINTGYELAGMLGHLAFSYLQVRDVMPPNVQQAAETMLRVYAERVHTWSPYFVLMNLGSRATWGYYLTWMATGDADVLGYYNDAIDGFYGNQSSGRYFPAGYLFDDGRYDSGYNGWNILHTVRILQLDPNPPQAALDAAHNMFDLQAHLTFQDRDGSWYSPNEFNTRSAAGAIDHVMEKNSRASAGGGIQRYLPGLRPYPGMPDGLPYAYAFMRDAEILGPRGTSSTVQGGHLDPNDPTFHQDLICQLSDAAFWMNDSIHDPPPSSPSSFPENWDRDYGRPLFAAVLFDAPELQDWASHAQNNPQLEDFPFEVEGPYTRSIDDEFVYVKFSGTPGSGRPYAALIHAGPVSPYEPYAGHALPPSYLPAGLGGGQLSMFWGPYTGAAMRGMRNGYNNVPADSWANWPAWPMHAATLVSATGEWTSSARIVTPSTDVSYYSSIPYSDQLNWDIDQYPCPGAPVPAWKWSTPPTTAAAAVLVRICGDIPEGVRRFSSVPVPALSAPMPYARTIYADENGMIVRTTLTPAVADPLSEAWETLPIYDQSWPGVTTYSAAEIYLVDAYGVATVATGGIAPVADVVQVYVVRADGAFQVLFDQPERVGVSGDWTKGYAKSNNLMIDLGRGQLPGSLSGPVSLGYRIEMLTDLAGNTQPL